MDTDCSEQQRRQHAFQRFANEHIAPVADDADREERLPPAIMTAIAREGCLGSFLPLEWGGRAVDMITYGLLHEEIGRVCSSTRSLITVHDMVALAVFKWGNPGQRARLLPALSSGETIAAFAVSEPNAGSDVNGVETTAERTRTGYVLNGRKKWISFGQVAGVFLVLARIGDEPTAFLVERGNPGLTVEPVRGLLGLRASMTAQLHLDHCEVRAEDLVGRPGFGAMAVVLGALGLGRYSVACGSLGIAQACLDACLSYAARRRQFGRALREHQLIQEMIAEMSTNVKASRLLCREAGSLKQQGNPREVMETFVAKYFASRTAMKAAIDAVQIHGANGCGSEYPVQRYFRDAKIMEVIEGSNEIQKLTIAHYAFQERSEAERPASPAAAPAAC